jgi:predicted outer membrane protein
MRKLCAGWIVAMGVLSSVALAQNQPAAQPGQQAQPGQPGQVRQPGQAGQSQTLQQGQFTQPGQQRAGQQGQSSRSDQEIAECVYLEASNEIEIAKLAEQKAQNEEVREFARQMVKEHSPGAQDMQHLAGNLASSQPQGGQRGEQGGLDWINVKKQIGQQCLTSVKQELSQKQGSEFDQCFMGQQIGAHMKVVDELKVLRNYASHDLQQKLDKELQTAQHHLQMAKQIEQKLKGSPSERVSRKSDGSNK